MSGGYEYVSAKSVLSETRYEELIRFVDGFPGIETLLSQGWIAGGFVRMILVERCSFSDYFTGSSPWLAGDVDFFFPSQETAHLATKTFKASVMELEESALFFPSKGGFTKEANVKSGSGQVKVQIVDDKKMCFPTIEGCLDDFDFLNCRVGLRRHDGILQFVIARGWREMEDAGLLHVMNNRAPFLGKRVMKYLQRRDLTGLSPGSADVITGWLVNVSQGMFPGFKDCHVEGMHDMIKTLRAEKIVKDEHLIFFLNKWTETKEERQGYGRVYIRNLGDWALNEIDKVNGGTGRKNNIDEEEEW